MLTDENQRNAIKNRKIKTKMPFPSKKNFLHFDKQLDVQLLKLVEQHRVLYDPSHAKHLDLDSRDAVWQQIGAALNKPAASCKTRWVNIRDMMRRRLRERIRNPHQRIYLYRYEDHLSFVIPFFKESLNAEYQSEFAEQGSPSQNEIPAEVYLEEADYSDDLKPNLRQLAATLDAQGIDLESSNDVSQFQELNSGDPIDVFLMTIGMTLKKFSPYYLNQAKSKIFQEVQDYELKQICNKDGNASSSSDHR